jgi:hypothetical protein
LHGVTQKAYLRIETHARDAPAEVELQQYPIGQAERALLPHGNEARRPLAVDEMAEKSSD